MKPAFRSLPAFGVAALALALTVSLAYAASKNPAGKLFVSSSQGSSVLNNGEKIEPLTDKSVFPAQGAIVESKADGSSVIVFSNGTGVQFGPQTRFEVKRFTQEPFAPNRNDPEVEPSISNTNIALTRGSVAVCTSRLVAGSTMNYTTPHAVIAIRGRKVMIETSEQCTKISLLEGDVTVRGGGEIDMGGQTLKPGQQAVIPGAPVGVAADVAIRDIPAGDKEGIEKRVTEACMARNSVYFDVGDPTGDGDILVIPSTPTDLPPNTVSNAVVP